MTTNWSFAKITDILLKIEVSDLNKILDVHPLNRSYFLSCY